MAFRKKRDDWWRWQQDHREFLIRIGVPEEVFESEKRWHIMVEHAGLDEAGYFKDSEKCWSAGNLPAEDKRKFYDFVAEHHPEKDILDAMHVSLFGAPREGWNS